MSGYVFEITKAAFFDAAHFIEQGPADHRYRKLHGHSFKVEVSVKGEMQDAGWVADLDFERFYLQPMDGPDRDRNTQLAVAYCLSHPQWRLSVQTHKYLGLP